MTRVQLYAHAFEFREMRLIAAAAVGSVAALAVLRPPAEDWAPAVVYAAGGWAVMEYVFHRFLLHAPQPKNEFLRRLHGRLHWRHHQDPTIPRLLFVPFWSTFNMLVLAFAGTYLGAGPAAAVGALLGLSLALFHYEVTHLAAHVPYVPRTRWGRYLKRFHRLHHYKNERYWFGVTHPFVDRVVGTWPAHQGVPKSKTARTLGVDED